MSITGLDDCAIIILREPFGRAICPFSFTDIVSEPVTNLGNDFSAYVEYDRKLLYSSHVHSLDPPITFNKSVSFRSALLADIVIPPSLYGRIDDFVDDIITIGYLDNNWQRLTGASLLSLYLFWCLNADDKSIARDNIVALTKLKVEGTLNEV